MIWLLLLFTLVAPPSLPAAAGELNDAFSVARADYRHVNTPAHENHLRDLFFFLPLPSLSVRFNLQGNSSVALLPRGQEVSLLPPTATLSLPFLPRPPPLA